MGMPQVLEFNPPFRGKPPSHLGRKEYAKLLDSVVIGCVDIAIVCGNKVLLGKRVRYPHKDWWIIGGRMVPGESFEETAQRKLSKELNYRVENFLYVGTYSAIHGKRHQSPQNNGSHTMNVVLAAMADSTVIPQINRREYSELEWVCIDKVIAGGYPEVLKIVIRDLKAALRAAFYLSTGVMFL